jgi:hypothetical protein
MQISPEMNATRRYLGYELNDPRWKSYVANQKRCFRNMLMRERIPVFAERMRDYMLKLHPDGLEDTESVIKSFD